MSAAIASALRQQERFWLQVATGGWSECWPWKAYRNPLGYGRFRVGTGQREKALAHRFAYELVLGPVPANEFVLHRCDNPACVNPSHLWLGTIAENNADRNAKERQARGERNGRAKLTPDDVREIRRLHARGLSDIEIAARYEVHSKTVYQIVRGLTWRHTEGGNA